MISCTEFIPLYSEFFKFLEKQGGHDAVLEYWIHISDTSIGDKTNPNSLAYRCDRLGGFDGAISYWNHTLTEEACNLFEIKNQQKKLRFTHMRHCPSRGMLNALKHVEPYYDYCSHCKVIYSRVLEKYGVTYIQDNSKVENAECSSILYETKNPPDFDFRQLNSTNAKEFFGEDFEVLDMKTEDNKYLHRDFHILGDNALKYCACKFGKDAVRSFLSDFTKYYYKPVIDKIKKLGLAYIKEWIESVYSIEEASEYLQTQLLQNSLTVKVLKSPVIEYMRSLNQQPSEYYVEQTRTLYSVIASESGYDFTLNYYNEDGGAEFVFSCK